MKRSRNSTSTILNGSYLVPWLAAEGSLAYSPKDPPARDYFFQYGWILPGIFNPKVNLREHFYFGSHNKRDASFLFEFWEQARQGHAPQLFYGSGLLSETKLKAPIAIYLHLYHPRPEQRALFIQHGSYQWVPIRSQPQIESGQVFLYRGVERAETFRTLRFEPEQLNSTNLEVWKRYLALQAEMLSDSVLSFNTIHDRTARSETWCLRDHTCLSDQLAHVRGLDIVSEGFAHDLWAATHQSFSLEPWVAQNKFGPHYVIFRTPLSNIRITTFFAGEAEVRIIDPLQLKIVETVGCRLEETHRV